MTVRLTVLVDNEPGPGLRSSWGLSILVERGDRRYLFDADTEPEVLEYNVRVLGVDLGSLEFALLSHPHSDHYGGFELVGRVAPGLTVYTPRGSGRVARLLRSWGLRPVEVGDAAWLAEGVGTTGPLEGTYMGRGIPEQAMVVESGNGAVILVGCSHPGVDNLVAAAVEKLGVKPVLVIGGFHGPSREVLDRLASLVEGKICPIHCSGEEAKRYVATRYPDKYCEARSGTVIRVEDGSVIIE